MTARGALEAAYGAGWEAGAVAALEAVAAAAANHRASINESADPAGELAQLVRECAVDVKRHGVAA